MGFVNLREEKPPEKKCKGLYFRGTTNQYVSSHMSVEFRRSLRLLKRMSCKGCSQCAWIFDDLPEFHNYNDLTKDIENGKLYKLKVAVYPGTYEYPDETDIEMEFIEVK